MYLYNISMSKTQIYISLCYQNGNMFLWNRVCTLVMHEQRSWVSLYSVPLLLRTILYPHILSSGVPKHIEGLQAGRPMDVSAICMASFIGFISWGNKLSHRESIRSSFRHDSTQGIWFDLPKSSQETQHRLGWCKRTWVKAKFVHPAGSHLYFELPFPTSQPCTKPQNALDALWLSCIVPTAALRTRMKSQNAMPGPSQATSSGVSCSNRSITSFRAISCTSPAPSFSSCLSWSITLGHKAKQWLFKLWLWHRDCDTLALDSWSNKPILRLPLLPGWHGHTSLTDPLTPLVSFASYILFKCLSNDMMFFLCVHIYDTYTIYTYIYVKNPTNI